MSHEYYDLNLEYKLDFVECMKRVYAWYDCEIIDRVPVRFSTYIQEKHDKAEDANRWNNLKDRWYDTEYQVEKYISTLDRPFLGETFPVFWANLGPNVYAGMLGAPIEFGDYTSWTHPILDSITDEEKIRFDVNNEYLMKLKEITQYALERCDNKFMVGYTDIHPNLDCLDAIRGTTELCMDMYDNPEQVTKLIQKCHKPFNQVMDILHEQLRCKKQLSVAWLNIPSYEGMHIPSCDLAAMLSPSHFDEFALPYIKNEIKQFKHNVFHLDGKGVANHIDSLLELEEINAIQWVQGVGLDKPIMQWLPLIKKIQDAGKGVVVDLEAAELDDFMNEVNPKGIYLCIDESDREIQQTILKKLLKWK